MEHGTRHTLPILGDYVINVGIKWRSPLDDRLQVGYINGINIFTHMPPQFDATAKHHSLQATGTLNPRADRVRHPLFQESEFFDPHDLLQLKYETVRAIQVENCPIARAASQFGLSRPTIYQAQSQFQEQGLEGLLPRKRGPQKPHKLTPEVRAYLQEQSTAEPRMRATELAQQVQQRFKVALHPRTIEKALHAKAKRGRPV